MGKAPFEADALDLVRRARALLRSRARTPAYFERGDRFAAVFLGGPLGTPSEYTRAAGTDLPAVLDTVYEDFLLRPLAEAAQLREMTERLQGAVEMAPEALPPLRARLDAEGCPLVDVASALLSAVTWLGYDTLARRASAEVAAGWLDLWKGAVAAHNQQQELHTGLCVLRAVSSADRPSVAAALGITEAALRPGHGTFLEGAERYLGMFSESGAAAMALVGALPFAGKPAPLDLAALIAFLRATPDLLARMSGLLRFAQDVELDPSEPISTGVFALAVERDLPVLDIDARDLPSTDIGARLRTAWEQHSAASLRRLATLAAGSDTADAIRPVLSEIIEVTAHIARRIAGEPAATP